MKSLNWIWILGVLFWDGCVAVLAAEADREPVEVVALGASAELEIDANTGQATGPNGVMVRHRGAVLTARTVRVDRQTGWVEAEGEVHLHRDGSTWRGDSLKYNFETKEMGAKFFRAGHAPLFVAGEGLASQGTNTFFTATNAYFTTDDLDQPGFRVRARKLTVIPGRYVEADGATFYLGTVPVMYFPRYRRSLERHPNNFVLLPGYRSVYGAFLLGEYNVQMTDQVSGTLHLDYRQRRGLGGGPDLHWQLGSIGKGDLQFYYTHDDDPRAGTPANAIPPREDRHRFSFSDLTQVTSNLTARVTIREQGDPGIVRDFFEGEYRRNSQPASLLELEQVWQNFSLDAIAQYQINDFYQTVERLPDVRLTGVRQQLGASPFFYESESSLGYLRYRNLAGQGVDYAAWRGDSFQQLLLPNTLFGWLQFTPRVGGRFTHYGEVDGSGSSMNEQDRWVFNTGSELSFKASRVWAGARSKLLEVDGLRHIFQPSVNYVFVPEPSRRPQDLPQFDYELHTLRLLPLDYPDYNAIDSIDSQNVVRLGIRNKLQTRREGEVRNLLNWSVYTDWRLRPRTGQGTFADFFSDLDFSPRSWIYFSSMVRYDATDGHLRETDHRVTLLPGETVSWALGHRYLRDDPRLGVDYGNNLIFSTVYFRLNENWGFRMQHHFEARDGTMEEQDYAIYRDMRSWTTALNFRIREPRNRPTDFSIGVTFSLKAFPRYKVGRDRSEPFSIHGS